MSQNSNPQPSTQALSFSHRYPCPVCRYGQIEGLFLVDAFSCGFCRHIFTVDALQQQLRLEDTAQPLQWCWTGERWVSARGVASSHSLLVAWTLGTAFILIPTALVWLAYHTFPPLPTQSGVPFPLAWAGLTCISHAAIVGTFYLEYYQIPLYMLLRLYVGRLWGQQGV